jgi:cellulose synthase/poly-beta-1,6-N-acetylglucosamine synthase-like glycosyltransferase
LIHALNTGLAESATATYIVRMDADDVSLPDRIRKQVDFMENHPEIAVCGTLVRTFEGVLLNQAYTSRDLQARMLYHCVLLHPSVIIRNSVLQKRQLFYSENYIHAEDYKLWADIFTTDGLAILPEVLLYYRLNPEQVSVKYGDVQAQKTEQIRLELFERCFQRRFTQLEQDMIAHRMQYTYTFQQVSRFYNGLLQGNQFFERNALSQVFKKMMLQDYYSRKLTLPLLISFLQTPFLTVKEQASLIKHFLLSFFK